MKRELDLVLCLAALPLAVPICLIVAILLRLESPGAVFFRQRRIGRGEAPFVIYKLRTMFIGTAELPSHEIDETRITPIGAILRKWKIDELPQILNVLEGTMSLVGPRPCLAGMEELLQERRKRGVFRLRPGITGLAQVCDIDMANPRRLARIDALYASRQSLALDFVLMLVTIPSLFCGAKQPTKPCPVQAASLFEDTK